MLEIWNTTRQIFPPSLLSPSPFLFLYHLHWAAVENMPREVQNGIVLVCKAREWGNYANMYFYLSLSIGDTALIFASNQTGYRAPFCFLPCLSQGLWVSLKVPTFIFLLNLQGISVTVAMIFFFLSFTANTCLYLFKSKHQEQGPKIFWKKHLTASEPAGVRLGRFPHISQHRIA